MKVRTGLIPVAAIFPFAWALACHDVNTQVTTPTLPPAVQSLKASLAPFASLRLAKSAGYNIAITDCMSTSDEGAMGVHFGNSNYIDGVTDEQHPEALIFEPGTDGQMTLVGVAFLVPFSAVPRTAAAPQLFGQRFQVNDVFGAWVLHVWTHRSNPSGLFATRNTRVHC
ncbi:MAG: hypothetical protein ABJE10_04125 [bacterium]